MGHAWTHFDPEPNGHEHPVVAVLAIVAILAAILLIAWAGLHVHGTGELEAALAEPVKPQPDVRPHHERERDAAVTVSRFATGFSP